VAGLTAAVISAVQFGLGLGLAATAAPGPAHLLYTSINRLDGAKMLALAVLGVAAAAMTALPRWLRWTGIALAVAITCSGLVYLLLIASPAGVAGTDALRAMSAAYRSYALAYPGRYAASVLAPAPGDEEHVDVATQAVEVIAAALAGYRLEGAALIHAVRMWRAACHGIATLQTAGGFGLPESVDVTFGYLVDALDAEFCRLGAIG
jgi:Tetracyclin repressor-like, C-terminal domain